MHVTRILMMLVLTICLSSAFAADWPQFLGPTGNGYSPETGLNVDWVNKAPQELWRISLSDDGYAGPSVADGKLFIIDHKDADDIVRAIDITTGKDVWQFIYADAAKSNYGFSRATPVFDGGRLYVLSRLGKLHCLDAKTGEKVWMRDIIADFKGRRPGWDMAMSPYIDGENVIVIPGGPNAAVAALNKMTGETIWQGGGSDVPGYATPTVAAINDKRQYLIFTAAVVMGVDPDNGSVLWSYPWKTGSDVNAPVPIAVGNAVFVTTNYGKGAALIDITAEGPVARWESKTIQSRFQTPIYSDGHIFTTTEANRLMCVDVHTGEIKWQQNGFGWGGLAAFDGKLVVMDARSGDVVLANNSSVEYTELGRIKPLGGESWTAPIIANGCLFIRNKQALVCLDLK